MRVARSIIVLPVILLLISMGSYVIYSNLTSLDEPRIFLSTTTSIENTGLLDYLIGEYQAVSPNRVEYTAVGSGAAIQLARDGEVDAVIVHAPQLEQELISDGFADERNILWYNYFILVGPADDPADCGPPPADHAAARSRSPSDARPGRCPTASGSAAS